jgi:hypothetical protein
MRVRSIGDVQFELAGERLSLPANLEEYEPFTMSSLRSGGPEPVRVDVVHAPFPDRRGFTLQFESDGGWRLLRRQDECRLEFEDARSREPRCVVLTDRATSRVRIFVPPAPASAGAAGAIPDPFLYPLDQLLLMHHLAGRGGFIVHAAGLALAGAGLIFPGISGAGKSTLTAQFLAAAPDTGFLSDDRVVVRAGCAASGGSGGFTAWGTPWPGTAKIAVNDSQPLRAVLFLVQAPAHAIVRLTPAAAARRLMPMLMCPWYDEEWSAGVLATVDRLVREVPCYELCFANDRGIVDLVRDFVRRDLAT